MTATSFAVPRLESDSALATAGYFQLRWSAAVPRVAIEETTAGIQRIIYQGPDRATLLSGLADGERSYRVGTIDEHGNIITWSEPVRVTVAHHPLRRALAFFTIGAVVFVATLVLIIHGARRYA